MSDKTAPASEMTAAFERDGYVALPGFLSQQELDAVEQALARFAPERLKQMPEEHVFLEDKNDYTTLKQIQQLFDYDAVFHRLMFGSRFEEVAATLLGDKVVGKNMQYFNKPPKVGQPTPPHQDGYYFMLHPPLAVTMWMALDEVDESNGCVRYVPGSHKQPMREHAKTGTLGFSQGITDYGTDEDKRRETPIPASPGDLLVHHAMTIHRADGNTHPTRTRRALGFIYYRHDAQEDKEAHEAYQRQLKEEWKQEGKI